MTFAITIMLLLATGYSADKFRAKNHSSANYPARSIAHYAAKLWRNNNNHRHHAKLKYVAGDRYLSSYISYFSPDHPGAFMEWNKVANSWLSIKQLKKYGAIFVLPDNASHQFPQSIKQQYPNLITLKPVQFQWRRNQRKMKKPIYILFGVLPSVSEKMRHGSNSPNTLFWKAWRRLV